jgi:phosphonate transport system substrate-binding protein
MPPAGISRRKLVLAAASAGALAMASPFAQARKQTLRFGVGPYLPSPEDTRKAYTPFFAHLAAQLGIPRFELAVTTDWAGLAVAMGSGNLDMAWMGPWGYVLANRASGCRAIATVQYEGKPTYHAIIIARPDLPVTRFPQDTAGRSISFADVGSTSGWLIPQYYAREVWKIDPRTFWKYTEGASHPGNEIAVQAGQVDLATDYDRNRNAMIDSGRIRPDSTRVVWQSQPLPNDAIAVAKDLPVELVNAAQQALAAIRPQDAIDLLPKRYTGFVTATHESYQLIERAGLALGRLKA